METNNGSNKLLTKQYIYKRKLIASCEAITTVAVYLTLIYFHITGEPYLVAIPQVGITASVDKVDIIL